MPTRARPRGRPSRSTARCFHRHCSVPNAQRKRWRARLPQALRRLGPGDRLGIVGDAPAGALDGDGEVLVLGERVGREAAAASSAARRHAPTAPGTTMIAPRPASARRSSSWAVTYSIACQRVTRLTRLPTLALPATAPIAGIGEPAGEPGDRLRLELGVGVERDDDLAAGQREAAVQRLGLAAIGEGQQLHPRFVAGRRRRRSRWWRRSSRRR